MRKIYCCIILVLAVVVISANTSSAHNHEAEIRYVQEHQIYDEHVQRELMKTTYWRSFRERHPQWHVIFNEGNQKPHRAYGNPIATAGQDLTARSWHFIANELVGFGIPASQLELIGTHESAKYQFANFRQLHEGLEIINSRLTLKFSKSGEVILFGLDVFENIQLSTLPAISAEQSRTQAEVGLHQITGSRVAPNLKVLAIPRAHDYLFRLVYEVIVEAMGHDGVPEEWEVLVDAHNGNLLSRTNRVVNINGPEANGNFRTVGTIYPKHPYQADSLVGLPHLRIDVGSNTFFTDADGLYDQGNLGALPFTGNFPLRGRWSRVVHGNTGMNTPVFSLLIDSLTDSVYYDNRGTAPATNSIRHLSAYYHTSLVHDYMKELMPNFTALDFPLTTRVDITTGSCNAFFNGNSINFYTTAGGCNALSMVADVVYHEYGHAITNYFYNSFGLNFQNGGMGEGYSDIFAITLNNDPVLGIGFSSNNANTFIRRYDVNPKIFPQNLVGQVHADGEIICGAWWRTGNNMGNQRAMMEILGESMYGLANAPNGQEGRLYADILIDALQADDDDNNLSNGTPNFNAIVSAFAFHGISLLANVEFNLSPFADAPENTPIPISVQINVAPPFDALISEAKMVYKLNSNGNGTPADTLSLSAGTGNTYTANFPAQPKGTIVYYYIALVDATGNLGAAQPSFANHAGNPNLPYNMLIGMQGYDEITFENTQQDADFIFGFSNDNATDGFWEIGVPIPSFVQFGQPATIVQPGSNATPGGTRAAFTKNAPSQTSPAGTADVDGGRTSILTPEFDLTPYADPVLSYMRWFTNNMGASPDVDNFDVFIRSTGNNWTLIERSRRSDRSWRRNVVRVSDFVQPTATVQLRFTANDLPPESLVEAAIDDIRFYDLAPAASVKDLFNQMKISVYPNPARERVYVDFYAPQGLQLSLSLLNSLGQQVRSENRTIEAGEQHLSFELGNLPAGMYMLQLQSEGSRRSHRLLIH